MSTQNTIDPVASFSNFLRSNLSEYLRPEVPMFTDMLAEDAVFEFPYAPPGSVTRIEGRAKIAEHVALIGGLLEFGEMSLAALHHTTQTGIVILEFSCTGRAIETGKPYNQKYISVITFQNGLITHYADYWNPLIVLEAMGSAAAGEGR